MARKATKTGKMDLLTELETSRKYLEDVPAGRSIRYVSRMERTRR